jgi:sarcosine oxidase, subunit gamma
MSEPALRGAKFDGIARIEEIGPIGMIGFRGDLTDPAIQRALEGVAGVGMPGTREITQDGARGLGWMSPDEALILLPYDDVAAAISQLGQRLADRHHLVTDISDARAVFRIDGPSVREVLAKLSPVDLLPSTCRPGELRRTRAAQVAAAFWLDDNGRFTLICFRSVARYVFDLLSLSAQPGTEVDLYQR